MFSRKNTVRLVLLALCALVIAALAACGGGVTQTEYDAVKAQLSAEQQKEAAYQQQLSAMQQQLNDKGSQAAAPTQAAQSTGGQSANPSGAIMLIGAKQMPPPKPANTPTPAPPGFTPPPKPQPPASIGDAVPFTFYVETIATTTTGASGWASTVSCTPDSVFKRGMKLVWRFEIFDSAAGGKRVLESDGAKAVINVPGADPITAHFTQRGGGRIPGAPWMWSAAWEIPLNYPLGAIDYTITLTTKDGRSFTWKTPAVFSADGSTDSRVKVVE